MILRLSGPNAFPIASALAGDLPVTNNTALRRTLDFSNLALPAWLYLFRARRSYTGEDCVELHVPGNTLAARMLLDELIRQGARQAEPGEFTARAYFNRRLDLTEAEGVAAIIAAGNERELDAARRLLAGELARRLRPTMNVLFDTLALVEVGIDFSEEDVSFLSIEQVNQRILQAESELGDLLESSTRFEPLHHAPQIVLVGRPNAGKSTLLNALAGRRRAVVSPLAGTTRDVLSAEVVLRRGVVQVLDIAGMEEEPPASHLAPTTADSVEQQMQRQARRALESADHVILVHDVTDERPRLRTARTPRLIVNAKADLLPQAMSVASTVMDRVHVSAITGFGIDLLRSALDDLAFGSTGGGSSLALNARHVRAIDDARDALRRCLQRLRDAAAELVALELRESLDALGSVLGQVTPDDVLGRIFSSFCIGK